MDRVGAWEVALIVVIEADSDRTVATTSPWIEDTPSTLGYENSNGS